MYGNQLKTLHLDNSFNIQKILVAPLDWGLGHATRCIPIIRALISHQYEVVIAAEGPQLALLQQEFPSLAYLPLEGYRVRYSATASGLPCQLARQLPRILGVIRRERQWLYQVIEKHKIDLVISDNRYGLSSGKVPCIFITHQLAIKAPLVWLEKLLQRINYHYINRFTCCWVPDTDDVANAAGALSHPHSLPHTRLQYIGLLSRFHKKPVAAKYNACFLLSGPEPQRTLLEKKIQAGLSQLTGNILLVRGKPGSNETLAVPANIEVVNHLPGNALQQALLQSELVISRSGYTTIMELLALQKKAILVPTPGQTEQEYLAEKLAGEHACLSVSQDAFNCTEVMARAKNFIYSLPSLPLFDENKIQDLLDRSLFPLP